MTGPEHYREAENCAVQGARADERGETIDAATWIALGQLHAMLALAAAIALPGDHAGDWQREIWAFGPETEPGPAENDPDPEVDEAPEHGPAAMRRFMREHPLTPGAPPQAVSAWQGPYPPVGADDDPDEPANREIEPEPAGWYDEPEPDGPGPGPEVDDEGAMSEYRYILPEDYQRGQS